MSEPDPSVDFPAADSAIPLPPETAAVPTPPKSGERLVSIDALRGFDMFWIMGADGLARGLCKWWGTPGAEALSEQFEHVEWEGFHFYDLIFPLFLFVVGAVIPFSLSKYRGTEKAGFAVYARVIRRVLTLFFLGLLFNNLLQFPEIEKPQEGGFLHQIWHCINSMRITGVLPRIAFCYGAAALLYLLMGTRARAILFGTILLGYWALFAFVPSPESHKAGDYSKETSLAGWVDRHYLPGKIFQSYYGYGDNEGLLSTIPAIATALLGVFAGEWLRSNRSEWSKVGGLLLAGLACLGIGYAWGLVFPIIKILWTSSYVLVVGGWSLILLGLFYAIIDVLKFRAWAFFWVVIGMNAITIYFLPKLINFGDISKFFLGGVARLSGPVAGAVILAVGVLAVKWLLLLYLYRRRIFLRL